MKRKIKLVLIFIMFIFIISKITSESRILKRISGNYQITNNNDNKWHLYIGPHQNEDRFFTIYDNGGILGTEEHPWIIGTIDKIEKNRITIAIDESQFHTVSDFDWTINDGKLVLYFELTGKTLTLSNENSSLVFEKQQYETNKIQ